MNNEECKVKACLKPMLISTIVVALIVAMMEGLIHGVWLDQIYRETASLWRPAAAMGMFPWNLVRLLVLSFAFSALYCKCKKAKENAEACSVDGKKECPKKHALCFGIVLGTLMGTMMASTYLWMPIPGELAVKWFIAGLAEGIVVAITLSCVCFNSKGGMCSKGEPKA